VTGPTATVDAYVAALPDDVRPVLEGIRAAIRAVVPGIAETISYRMPTFVLDGLPLLHVAAWKKHIGLYPLPPMDDELARQVQPYRAATDTMRLRYAEPIPYDLVERVVAAMVAQRRAGAA
jgi:uncharacterized protein YdhG (YjbR/CyaY superfamily)